MVKDEMPRSFPMGRKGRVAGARGDLIWRTRVLPGSRAGIGIMLAIDVSADADWAPRGARRPLAARALQLVVQVTEAAVREGFWAELRPARACHDPDDEDWRCAALLHLVRQSAGRDCHMPPTLPVPMQAHCPVCRG